MPRDLYALIDVREVIARIVDGSEFEEFKARYGPTLICGWAWIHGYPVGILGNNGPLFSESSEKATQFIQLCNQQDIPLLFLQNITGYMVGKDFEHGGIVKNGSKMINAVSNSTVPHITVILGSSYGAGNYGMSGRAFNTRFTYLWPTAKIAIMGPKQIAGVMSLVRRGQAARKGLEFDEDADRKITESVEHYHELGSLALFASGRVSDDGIIDPRDTRDVIGMSLSVCHNNVVEGSGGFWCLPDVAAYSWPTGARSPVVCSPRPGTWASKPSPCTATVTPTRRSWPTPIGPWPWEASPRPRATSTRTRSSTQPSAVAPTPSTPATAFSRRTPSSPRP